MYAKLPMESQEESWATRRRSWNVRIPDVEFLLLQLRQEKFTGKVTINMSQGGMNTLVAEDVQHPHPYGIGVTVNEKT